MSTRAEKALKAQKDKHHTILRELVQEPPNKTCADCLAKGPRWASWNIGIFVCIRCAGIHRNLGVHISKCKSIDLDSWTTEQIEHFLKWGNKRAAEYYECYLPKDFSRAQGNQAVETFIRNKYEKKLYMKKDGEPEPHSTNKHLDKLRGIVPTEKENKTATGKKKEKVESKSEEKTSDKTILNIAKKTPEGTASVQESAKLSAAAVAANHVKSSSMSDLLGMGHATTHPTEQAGKNCASTDDLLNFGAFSDPVPSSSAHAESLQPCFTDPAGQVSNGQCEKNTNGDSTHIETSKSTKESILSLYSTGNTNQQKMYGIPGGVYMQSQQQQQQQQQQPNMMYGYTQQPMSNQMQQMNSQMQQMNFNMSGQQSNPYNQQHQHQPPMNNFGSSGQPAYATPMYTSNSSMMANQMNSVYQHQKFQSSTGVQNQTQPIMAPNNSGTGGSYGNGMQGMQGMNSAGWNMNICQQQQQPQQPQPQQQQPGQFNMNPAQMNSGMMMNGAHGNQGGYTMNNQLWN